MKVPNFYKTKAVNEDGYLTDDMHQFFDVQNVQMQQHLSDDGIVIPSKKTSEINYIASNSTNNSKPNGTIWYDEQTHQMKSKINGVVKTFTMA